MLKKTITYTDYNGVERTEDHYFHLSEAEALQLEKSHNGGLSTYLHRIINSLDEASLIIEFKNIIDLSYGRKSDDGRNFRKSPEILADFASTEAYSILYMELVTDTNSASSFVNGIMPKKLADHKSVGTGSGIPAA